MLYKFNLNKAVILKSGTWNMVNKRVGGGYF